PPFVFLPIFGFGALLLALAYWAFSVIRRPRRLVPMPTAAVVHRATRPDYSAAFGTPPARPADTPLQSAWNEPLRAGGTRPPAVPSGPPPFSPAPPPMQAAPVVSAAPGPSATPAEAQTDEAPQHHGAWGLGVPDSGYPNLSAPET